MTYRDKENTLLAEIERLNLKNQELEKSLVLATKPKERKSKDLLKYMSLTWFCFLMAVCCLIFSMAVDTNGLRFSFICSFISLSACGTYFFKKTADNIYADV